MTDVIDAVEAATIAVVDMSFKVTTPRLAGHWLGVALNCVLSTCCQVSSTNFSSRNYLFFYFHFHVPYKCKFVNYIT